LLSAAALCGRFGKITAVMEQLAAGMIDVEIPAVGHRNEIAAMANAVRPVFPRQ